MFTEFNIHVNTNLIIANFLEITPGLKAKRRYQIYINSNVIPMSMGWLYQRKPLFQRMTKR
uniref:Uncharacterized protein n=1 Tax=Octopus bimaculoides TaxID=37653 RepID=A0A0L8I475_OCTBM